MAKKKKSKSTGLIFNVVIIALAVLTVCTLFMPILKSSVLTLGAELGSVTATGADVFTGAFASEASLEMSEGSLLVYGLRTAEENFVAVVMIWSYMLTVMVALGTIVFAVLGLLGMRFKLVNTVLGGALVVLAIVAFIFALVVASKNTAITEAIANKPTGTKMSAMISAYLMFAGVVAGGLEVYRARQK